MLNVYTRKATASRHLPGGGNDDPFLNPLFDYRILLKLDPKRPAPPFEFNEGCVADRRLLIYTLLLNPTREPAR